MSQITINSHAEDVADELSLTSSAYAEDVTGEVSLASTAYAEDVADAINGGVTQPTLRVMQFNIGHFNMGLESSYVTLIGNTSNSIYNTYPQLFNYDARIGDWEDVIGDIDADIIGMPEWSDYFGYKNGVRVATTDTDIFEDYPNISVGKTESDGYWINTLASKTGFPLSNAENIDLGSTVDVKAYVRVAEATIGGVTTIIGVTHLNWNRSDAFYSSRQTEIANLIGLFTTGRFKDYSHVIIFGDFNTGGEYGNTDYSLGLAEFNPFLTAGFACAICDADGHRIMTASATNSRPDNASIGKNQPYCYIDNIIVRGFEMRHVTVVDPYVDYNGKLLSDHCAVVCDLYIE